MKIKTVSVNEFVRRQVKGSGKSYTSKHSFEDIAHYANKKLAAGDYSLGYRDGVIVVNADRELVSFHAFPEEIKKLPMNPVTMMRNQLGLPGGTAVRYRSEEWAESIHFWQKYAAQDQAE
jgi:hypothetical protein